MPEIGVWVQENLGCGNLNSNSTTPRCLSADPDGWSSTVNPFNGYWSTAAENQLKARKTIKIYKTKRLGTTAEWEAHRAAKYDSCVRLKRHVVVHRQLSVREHENLRAGFGRLNANTTILTG